MDKKANSKCCENEFLKQMIKELVFYILRQPFIKIDNEKDLEIKKIIEFVFQMTINEKNETTFETEEDVKENDKKIIEKITDYVLRNEDNFNQCDKKTKKYC